MINESNESVKSNYLYKQIKLLIYARLLNSGIYPTIIAMKL